MKDLFFRAEATIRTAPRDHHVRKLPEYLKGPIGDWPDGQFPFFIILPLLARITLKIGIGEAILLFEII